MEAAGSQLKAELLSLTKYIVYNNYRYTVLMVSIVPAIYTYRLRHPNVVELMGYHDSPECMALVYEFVERGSLYDNLHKVDS